MTASSTRYTFILIHGAWQGAWAWDTIVPRLKALGHEATAVDLPGNGHNPLPPEQVDLDRYAAHVVDVIDRTEGPIIMVGHSMGGTAAAQACELRPERIALAIFLCAFMLPDGMSVLQFYERYLEPWMRGAHARVTYDEAGLLSRIDPASAVEVFYQKADRALAEAAAHRLTPQPEGGRRSQLKLSPERFGTVPRVYIEAREDRSVHLPLQRKMQELSPCLEVYGLDSDHAPQLSQPDELVALFMKAVAAHARTL
ncbi:alpha/beta fold hydrolase [Bradyrhizobium sp. Ai1a-2]|uniref:alpha/beta fold hydrolase n=1 Tax=Bradyrhizobium sp. Ai1a-2 TaxID=196490 RepID=UPI00041FF017|nr:alpha/beta fold hydrolase [Bradyrhizobium sp. Ai1a-2]